MRKILVIDDNPDTLDLLKLALEIEDYEVIVANGGESGLEKLRGECPDLVLLDYSMPGMSGIEVARLARMDHADLPIIFITAHGNLVADAVAAIRRTSIIPKPFMLGTLSHRVTAMLQTPVH